MLAVDRALRTAEAQIEEAEATARIRNSYSEIMATNAQALFTLIVEGNQRKVLTQALKDINTDSSMLHRGLIVQVSGIFENFVRSICEAVLAQKARNAGRFADLDIRIQTEYIHQSAVVLTHSKEGSVRGRNYDFEGLKRDLAGCMLNKEDFEIRAEVFTLLMGNCTSSTLTQFFGALCLTDPFDDRIGEHSGLKKYANQRSKRKVAKFVKRTLDEQIHVRNEVAHGNLTRSVTPHDFQNYVQFFKQYMNALALSINEDLR